MSRPQSAVRALPTRPASELHQRLEIFIGCWHTHGSTVTRAGAPSVMIHSSDIYEWLPGGRFVVHRWKGQAGDADVHGLEVIGVDRQSGAYQTSFFDNDGNSGCETLTVRGRTWTWLGRQALGSPWHRCIAVVSDDGRSITALHEQSDNGTTWTPWMRVTLRRTE